MKKILVTGGAGYIGSHTVVELIRAGYNPIIIDNLCNTSTHNIYGIENITKKNSYTDASVIRSPYETRRRLIIRDVLLYCDVLLLLKSKKKKQYEVSRLEPNNPLSRIL